MKALHQYQDIFSLGSSCQAAYQLRRMKLRREAGPLDWFISSSVPGLVKLLQLRFHGFMELSSMQLIGRAHRHYVIRDTVYTIDSYHDFPFTQPEGEWQRTHDEFKRKIDRRSERLIQALEQSPSLLLVRTQMTKEQAAALQQALHSLIRTPDYLLLAVNTHEDPSRRDTVPESWGLDHVAAVTLPKGADWRGSDAAWSALFQVP
ncbi:DUF1796 family putative cysteine peptidase [Paenibacillus chartarius]|uniref:DUF1796 family putative cysteine peptidase n=1 Tax=Paenibacillus chartarius TaxID=747481 RepID=A0ABV6DRQ7_9BACL